MKPSKILIVNENSNEFNPKLYSVSWDSDVILENIKMASLKVSALKKTNESAQREVTNKLATILLINFSSLFLRKLSKIKINKPLISPHMIKFHEAPCHKPLRINTIKMFLMCLIFTTLLPPKGM